MLDYNVVNRVVVEHKGSVKGNVFLTSHSRGSGKGFRVVKGVVRNIFFKLQSANNQYVGGGCLGSNERKGRDLPG